MKAKTKIKTLLLGMALATAFATVGVYGFSTEYETFNPTTITADAVSAAYSGTPAEPTKITNENLASYGLADSYVGYYAIKTAEELAWFASYIDKGSLGDLTASAVLLDDIIYNAGMVTESGSSLGTTHNWNPIGDWGKDWSGTFDGNGHFVSGLYAKRTWSYTGFIAYTNGATVKNVTIKNSYFQDGLYLGGIVGLSQNGTTITGCRVESSVTIKGVSSSGADWVGGIVGNAENTTITNCYVAATVSGNRLTGAISGENEGVVTMSNNHYVTGCTTAKGVAQNAVGKNSSTGETVPDVAGQNTAIASESSAHTCVPVQATEVAGVYDAYTYCSVCYEVLSVTHKLSYEGVMVANVALGDDYYAIEITETCANCPHSEKLSIGLKSGASLVYTGSDVTPYEIVYTDGWVGVKKTNADIVYVNNSEHSSVNAGRAQAYINLGISGTGFNTTEYMLYNILKAIPKAADFVLTPPAELTYNGEQKTASVSIGNNIVGMGDITTTFYKDGVATAEIVEPGEYTAKISVAEGDNYTAIDDLTVGSFTVQPREITASDISLSTPDLVGYNGEAQEPAVSVVVDGKTLVLDTDYTLSWNKTGFVNADTYTVTVTGKDNYSGTVTRDYVIAPKAIVDSEITIDVTEATYDGNAHEPTITVKDGAKTLAKDVDYTLTWDKSGFVNAGTYTATVEGINNYDGMYTRTLVINKEILVLELSAPILKVLPGNRIALTLTVNSTEGTPVWNVVGGTHVSGTTVQIDDSLVIGQDKVTITVTYAATTNYTGDSKTIELEVGMADFTAEIDGLEDEINTLKALLVDKADSATVTQQLNEILGKVEALEQVKDDYKGADESLKQELTQAIATAKQEAIDAVQANLDQAVIDLNKTISDGDDELDKRITDEVKALSEAIDLAEKAAKQANDDLQVLLEGKLADAEKVLNEAIDAVQENLDQAVVDLNKTISDGDDELDKRITDEVKALSEAIDLAEEVAKQANDDLQALLEGKLADAEKALNEAIDAVQANLDQAVVDLNKTISNGDDELDERITDEVATLNGTIELAKSIAALANDDLKARLENKINAADKALQNAIDAVQANLDKAVEDLSKLIASGDEALAADLAEAIENLNEALDLAEKVSADSDKALEEKLTALTKALNDAKKEARRNDILPIVLGSVGIAGNLIIALVWVVMRRKKVK